MSAKGILKIKVLGDTSDWDKSAKSFDSKLGSLGKTVGKLGAALGLLWGAKSGVEFFTSAALAAATEEQAIANLANVTRNLTGATDAQCVALDGYIHRTQAALGFTEEQLRPSMVKLVTATRNVAEAEDLMGDAMDISRGRGVELDSVAKALARAHDGQTTALSRLGIATKDVEGNQKDFKTILDDMERAYGGSAQTHADQLAGKYERLKLVLGETKETIGSAFLPVLLAMSGPLMDAAKWVGDLATNFAAVSKESGLLAGFEDMFGKVGDKLGQVFDAINWEKVGQGVASAVKGAIEGMGAIAIEVAPKIVGGAIAGTAEALFDWGQKLRLDDRYKRLEEYLALHPTVSFEAALRELENPAGIGAAFKNAAEKAIGSDWTGGDTLKIKIRRLEIGFTDVVMSDAEIQQAVEGGYPAEKIAELLKAQQNKVNEQLIRGGAPNYATMLFDPEGDLTEKFGEFITVTNNLATANGTLAWTWADLLDASDGATERLDALGKLYGDLIAPTDAWKQAVDATGTAADIAAGKYDAAGKAFVTYMELLEGQLAAKANYEENVQEFARLYAAQYGDAMVQYAATQGPEVLAGFLGLDETTQASVLGLWRQTMDPQMAIMGGEMATMSQRYGEIAGMAAARGWVDKYGTGVRGYLGDLGASLGSMYSGIGGVGANAHASGTVTHGPEYALIGDNPSGREAVIPLDNRADAQRVLGQAAPYLRALGIGFDGVTATTDPVAGMDAANGSMEVLVACTRQGVELLKQIKNMGGVKMVVVGANNESLGKQIADALVSAAVV